MRTAILHLILGTWRLPDAVNLQVRVFNGDLEPGKAGTCVKNAVFLVKSVRMQNRLYVGNLARDVTADTLQALFESHGFVLDVKLVANRGKGRPQGFGVVTMATDEAARTAMHALDGSCLHGEVIKVAEASSSSSHLPLEPGRPS